MKCPSCGNNHKKKLGLKCSCGYKFALDPSQHGGISDNKIQNLARKVSEQDTLWFTEEQLYSEFLKSRMFKKSSRIGCGVVGLALLVAAAAAYFAVEEGGAAFVLGVLGLIALIAAVFVSRGQLAERSDFRKAVHRYEAVHGVLSKRLRRPSLGKPPPKWPEADIYDYGVERILIVDQDLLVDLFVMNGLHAENRCLVVAESGYPKYIAARAAKVLEERPDTPVFLLHDYQPGTAPMVRRMKQQPPFALGQTEVTDLGLNEKEVESIGSLRRLRAARGDGKVPVDLMSNKMLMLGVGGALLSGVALADIREQTDAGSSSFG